MIKGKNILLGISGSIAAYMACDLARTLIKGGGHVQVIMTESAARFITPLTMQTLTGRPVILGMFDEVKQWDIEHIGAAKWADVLVIAPATANIIAKLAAGIADDSLSATFLACDKPKVIAPAMNTVMLDNPATQANIALLKARGCRIADPQFGLLACGDEGRGKLADTGAIVRHIAYALQQEKPLLGLSVLVTAGPTREEIDPVRFISNHSTGRMGYAIAYMAWLMGAKVTLVCGPAALEPPPVDLLMPVVSAREMGEAVLQEKGKADIVIKAAAVADYTPKAKALHKLKKQDGDLSLALMRTTDILAELGRSKPDGQVLVGFAAETRDVQENATDKMRKKNVDLMAANDLTDEGSGFGTRTNRLLLLWPDGRNRQLNLMDKEDAAKELLLAAHAIWVGKGAAQKQKRQ